MKRGNQTRLAKTINKTDGFISQILSGKRRPSWNVAKDLAAATGTTPNFWMDTAPDKLRDFLSAANF